MGKVASILLIIVSMAFGVFIAKSGALDYIISGISQIRMPSITIPDNPLTAGLKLLLALPSMNFVAFGVLALLLNALAWWIGGPQGARRIVVLNCILLLWGLISYIVTTWDVQATSLKVPAGLLMAFGAVRKGSVKEKGEALPPAYPEEPSKREPWAIEGLGSQGAFNAVSQVKAMANLGSLPISNLFIGVSERGEVDASDKALSSIKANALDRLFYLFREESLPPYRISCPRNLGAGIGCEDEAIRCHADVLSWIENEMIPWTKEHWTPHLLRFFGVGWTGLIYGVCRDALLSFEGWAHRQYRVSYVHVANRPPETLVNLKDFLSFSGALNDGFVPTFDANMVSYEGKKPPSENQWEALTWEWKGRMTREKAEIIHHMALAILSRAGVKPTLKEITLMARLSPIKTIYLTESIALTPLKRGLLKTRVDEELNRDAIRAAIKSVIKDLRENGVREQVIMVCFGQLSEDWRELLEDVSAEEKLDADISNVGFRFGSKYSFIVGMGPVLVRPCRWLEEPLGAWRSSAEEKPIESLMSSASEESKNNNPYFRAFSVYARHLGLQDAFKLFEWRSGSP